MSGKKSILVLGVEFTEERFPNLYRIAETNPEGLAAHLKALLDGTDVGITAVILEHDLEHERLCGG